MGFFKPVWKNQTKWNRLHVNERISITKRDIEDQSDLLALASGDREDVTVRATAILKLKSEEVIRGFLSNQQKDSVLCLAALWALAEFDLSKDTINKLHDLNLGFNPYLDLFKHKLMHNRADMIKIKQECRNDFDELRHASPFV
jgi:hypothetical protein